LSATIPLPNVQGRIDHFALDPGGRVFVCVVGNDSVEVLETLSEKRVHTITGIPHPQGVVFASDFNKLFVASRDGKLYIYDGTPYDLITSIDFHDDVDNLRYDPVAKRVYVGFGDEGTAAIGMVDAATNQRIPEEFKLGAHPESFQLESAGPRIFVNLADLKQIAVIDRRTGVITKWPLSNLEGNFPMALDESDHRLFVGTRTPPRLVVLDTNSGATMSTFRCAADSDDLYYDSLYKRVYVAGGQGFISVFAQNDPLGANLFRRMDRNNRNSLHHFELHAFNERHMGLEFQTLHPQEKRRGFVERVSANVWHNQSVGSWRPGGHQGHWKRKTFYSEALRARPI
jgi:DNA-binding beta-propeller fold protein YncE